MDGASKESEAFTYQCLYVDAPDGSWFELRGVPGSTLPSEITKTVLQQLGRHDTEAMPRCIVDVADPESGRDRRLVADTPLRDQSVQDGARLRIGIEASAGGGTIEAFLAFAGAGVLLPFVTTFSSKVGEEAYNQVRKLLSLRTRSRAKRQILQGDQVVVADGGAKVILRIGVDEPTGQSQPEEAAGWEQFTWDPRSGYWHREQVAAPPPGALRVGRHRRRRRSSDGESASHGNPQ